MAMASQIQTHDHCTYIAGGSIVQTQAVLNLTACQHHEQDVSASTSSLLNHPLLAASTVPGSLQGFVNFVVKVNAIHEASCQLVSTLGHIPDPPPNLNRITDAVLQLLTITTPCMDRLCSQIFNMRRSVFERLEVSIVGMLQGCLEVLHRITASVRAYRATFVDAQPTRGESRGGSRHQLSHIWHVVQDYVWWGFFGSTQVNHLCHEFISLHSKIQAILLKFMAVVSGTRDVQRRITPDQILIHDFFGGEWYISRDLCTDYKAFINTLYSEFSTSPSCPAQYVLLAGQFVIFDWSSGSSHQVKNWGRSIQGIQALRLAVTRNLYWEKDKAVEASRTAPCPRCGASDCTTTFAAGHWALCLRCDLQFSIMKHSGFNQDLDFPQIHLWTSKAPRVAFNQAFRNFSIFLLSPTRVKYGTVFEIEIENTCTIQEIQDCLLDEETIVSSNKGGSKNSLFQHVKGFIAGRRWRTWKSRRERSL